jgi:SAM-dependent methyltransferase
MKKDTAYFCPLCKDKMLKKDLEGLFCKEGHSFPFFDSSEVPVFARDDSKNEFTTTQAAEIHDNALRWLFKTFEINESELRDGMLSRLNLLKGQRVLITSAGAGNDLPCLAKMIGKEGVIYAQDYAPEMLMAAVDRAENLFDLGDYNIEFSISDATNLPFDDDYFDSAYHFGGLNLFSDIGLGISEMDRVVKDGGRVVVGDEGLAPWLLNTEYGEMLSNNNPLYRCEIPLKYLPDSARDVNLSWVINNCFYLIDYTVSKEPLYIDIDLKHVGRRGGTIRTRYFGKLEGINPELKEQLYEEAESQGLSRVELLETLIKNGLSK